MKAGRRLLLRARIGSLLILGLAGLAVLLAGREFRSMHEDPPIHPGPGVSRILKLGSYAPTLSGTAADTEVYVLEGAAPGGTVLVLGGTHPNEPASHLAALLLVENAVVAQGRLLVVPRANRSGFTATTPFEGWPQTYFIDTPAGRREFRFGSRDTNPVHQWPDPITRLSPSGESLTGAEVRNLNRAYPGDPRGNLTERLAWAIVRMIAEEGVDAAVDLHEASPEYPVVNAIVAHERALDVAVEAAMLLEAEGIAIGVEGSPENLGGLSHREWGDATQALAFLLETTNPAQGRLRGRTDNALIVTGKDRYYTRAAGKGLLSVPFGGEGHPLEERVGRHLETLRALLEVHAGRDPARSVSLSGLPGMDRLLRDGLGAYLAPRR